MHRLYWVDAPDTQKTMRKAILFELAPLEAFDSLDDEDRIVRPRRGLERSLSLNYAARLSPILLLAEPQSSGGRLSGCGAVLFAYMFCNVPRVNAKDAGRGLRSRPWMDNHT